MPIMLRALSLFTALFGLVCTGIALTHLAIGPLSIPGSIPVNATMDSEDRFYATLFLGFGLAAVWSSRDLRSRNGLFVTLMAVFFVGGLARIVSFIMAGPPNDFFEVMTVLELVIPPASWLWLNAALRWSG
jgi:Domain of unknown function (DUF4345)